MDKILVKKWAKRIGATVLGAAVLAGGVLGIGYSTGLFGLDNVDSTIDEGSGLVVGESNGHNMQISKTTVGPSSSSYTLTATITPTYATNPNITWSISFVSSDWFLDDSNYLACEDVYGDEWYNSGKTYSSVSAGLADIDISSYVTLSATTGSSVTVTCLKAFGDPIIVTATSESNSSCTASCQLDYHSRVTGVELIGSGSKTFSSSGGTTNYIYAYVSKTTGTLFADFTVTYSCQLWDDWFSDMLDGELYALTGISPYSTSSEWKSYDYLCASGSTDEDSVILASYSTNWVSFVRDLLASTTTYSEKYLSDFANVMNNLSSYGISLSSAYFYRSSVSVVDNFTNSDYRDSGYVTLASLDDFPSVSVTYLTINETSVVF